MKVKALTPFVHNRYDLNEGQEVDMPEATANDLKDAGLVELVGEPDKTARPTVRQARSTPASKSASPPANKLSPVLDNKLAPVLDDKGPQNAAASDALSTDVEKTEHPATLPGADSANGTGTGTGTDAAA